MRSNDLWLGFPFDVFQFANMQVLMAMELGVELGTYTHIAGSLHLYERDFKVGWDNVNKSELKPKATTDISKAKEEAGNEWMNEKDKLMMEALRKADAQMGISERLREAIESEYEAMCKYKEELANGYKVSGTGKSPTKGVGDGI